MISLEEVFGLCGLIALFGYAGSIVWQTVAANLPTPEPATEPNFRRQAILDQRKRNS